MKEEDLKKNLDNLIIDGLIKEAEQDDIDFEAAMRNMSEKEFDELIYYGSYVEEEKAHACSIDACSIAGIPRMLMSESEEDPLSDLDVLDLDEIQLKKILPALRDKYEKYVAKRGIFRSYKDELRQAGWNLVLAYIKLRMKEEAIEVLWVLSARFGVEPFGVQCRALIELLD